MPNAAPRLETARLILREFRRDDLDAFAATMAHPDVVRHLAIEPLSREDSLRRIFLAAGQWPILGMGMRAVELKADGRMVGHVGFFDMERDMTPSLKGEPEMGWIFDPSVHGQGIAREACQAALEWAEREIGAASYPAIIDLENAPSMKLAERLGFVRQPNAVYRNAAIGYFRMLGNITPSWTRFGPTCEKDRVACVGSSEIADSRSIQSKNRVVKNRSGSRRQVRK